MKVDSEWDEDKGQSQGNHARLNRIMHYYDDLLKSLKKSVISYSCPVSSTG